MKKFLNKSISTIKEFFNKNIKHKNSSYKVQKNSFIFLLITIPILISSLYFYSIGRKRYFVKSDIIIRKASQKTSLDIKSILGAGNQSAIEDSYFLQTYLESPQVLRDLEKVIDFEEVYKKKGIDFYAGLAKNSTYGKRYHFFRKQISTTLDERTGILRIRSLGLDPKTTFDLNNFLLRKAESFVNELNQSIFREQLGFLNKQVFINAKKLKEANTKLSEFQQNYQILDVQAEAAMSSAFIKELEEQLVTLKVQLAAIQRRFINKNAPEIILLKDQIEELNNQIISERNILINPSEKNLAKRIIEMNELKSVQQFANELYLASLKAAEKANIDSVQRQRFLATISEPQLPEEEWMDWRHRGFLTTLSIYIIFFSVAKFILGMADSHNN